MERDLSFLNRTENKWLRTAAGGGGAGVVPAGVVWHETASPSPDNPHGTLDYNLSAKVLSSYNYLIARTGLLFPYVDEKIWVAYHAGVHSRWNAWANWEVNVHTIGVEIDGRNDGTPATPAQIETVISLMLLFYDLYAIPIDRASHRTHREVTASAPGYKSDPRGVDLDALVAIAQARLAARGAAALPLPGGIFRVAVATGNIRSGPGTGFASVGSVKRDELLTADTVVAAQSGPHPWWVHLADGRGYVSQSLLAREKEIPALTGLTFSAPPRIGRETFAYVLQKGTALGSSPAAPQADQLYDIIVASLLDPAVALAFFAHESQFGNAGVCRDLATNSWGNVRTPYTANPAVEIVAADRGGYAKYPSWDVGLQDWCDRIQGRYIAERKLTTVELAIPVYAPSTDGNDTARYIAHVRELVDKWQQIEKGLGGYGFYVDPTLESAWRDSGGIWRGAGLLAPGYATGRANRHEGQTLQAFERAVLRLDAAGANWLLLSEMTL